MRAVSPLRRPEPQPLDVWFSDASVHESPYFCQVCWAYGGVVVRHRSQPDLTLLINPRPEEPVESTPADVTPLAS